MSGSQAGTEQRYRVKENSMARRGPQWDIHAKGFVLASCWDESSANLIATALNDESELRAALEQQSRLLHVAEVLLHSAYAAAVDGWPTPSSRDQFTLFMTKLYGYSSFMGNRLGLYERPVLPDDFHETYELHEAVAAALAQPGERKESKDE
jgi:hypothetical protein